MSGRGRGLGLRGRLLASVLAALAAVLAVLVTAFNLVLADRLAATADGVVSARANAEIAALRVTGDRIVLPESPDGTNPDVRVWVFTAAGRAIEYPSVPRAERDAAAALAARAPGRADVAAVDVRLLALPVTGARGRPVGAVVAGVSLRAYRETRATALAGSIVLALIVLVAAGLGAWWLIGRSLRPVARMTRQAGEWSVHAPERRFALGGGADEISELGRTLDDMLARIATTLRHEQRLTAEISHELRTPLAGIVAEAQLALRHGAPSAEGRAALEAILGAADRLGRTLDTLLAAARSGLEPGRATCDARACAAAVIAAAGSIRGDRGDRDDAVGGAGGPTVALEAPDGGVRVAAGGELVERILAPVLENALRHAAAEVRVTVSRDGDTVRVAVTDDGPGIPEAEREAIFAPGRRGGSEPTAPAAISGAAGLGLALCRRLATTAGGDVRAEPSAAGGRVVVRLPAA